MVTISDEEFQTLIDEALATLPADHVRQLRNAAIVREREPSLEQRRKLGLRRDETLFGLYEGVPLTQRQGMTNFLPDKITIFMNPICASVNTHMELKEQIRHTLWHEIAHYFGLGHTRIHELEGPHGA